MTDRAQDTEAIRAARELLRELDVTEPESFPFVATRRVREVVVGLVARLEAAEQALDSIIVRCEEGDPRTDWLPTIASIARAALAAAAPGEPTTAWSAGSDFGRAAPGETEQTP